MKLHDYDIDAAVEMMDFQAYFFTLIPEELPDADIDKFIISWMQSDTRRAIDTNSPKFLNKSGSELFSWFMNQEINHHYERGTNPKRQRHVLHWVGLIYQCYAYHEKMASAELVSLLPPHVLYEMYYPWHELSDLGAVQKIKTEYMSKL